MRRIATTEHSGTLEIQRRLFLGGMGALLTGCRAKQEEAPAVVQLPRRRVQFPGKVSLYLLTDRPPQLETPVDLFTDDLTPNKAFFVRWHLADVPKEVDLSTFRLEVKGNVQRSLSLSVDDLRQKYNPVTYVALNQCSGNSRGLFQPRIPGGQWGHGAMGNARWSGARLRDILDAAGAKSGAIEVSFDGLDKGTVASVPDYVKTLPIEKAREEDVIVAYEMNGEPLPMLNGFPLRLVVPGWYATYWVKALSTIEVRDTPFEGFWMSKAYRIPSNPTGAEEPDQLATDLVPITRMCIHSIFVKPGDGEKLTAGRAYPVEGVATDGGGEIQRVEVSTDGGATWQPAQLAQSLGRYSWRRWRYSWTPERAGSYTLKVRAENAAGDKQVESHWNRSGYMRQIIEEIRVEVV